MEAFSWHWGKRGRGEVGPKGGGVEESLLEKWEKR